MNKELRTKTNEELCTIIMRMKLQLLEARFAIANGEIQKTHKLPEIRKTIARALTILEERNTKVSIGTHGIIIHDAKTGESKAVTELVMKNISDTNAKEDKSAHKAEAKHTAAKTEKVVKQEHKTEAKHAAAQTEKEVKPVHKAEAKKAKAVSQVETKKQVIRRKVGA
jgi:large subunit ribosomal protein L29